MKCLCLAPAVAALLLPLAPSVFASPTANAQATLVSPGQGQVFHYPYPVPPTYKPASIPLQSSNHSVSVTGGTPNGLLTVSYVLHLDFNGQTYVSDDSPPPPNPSTGGYIPVTYDANGNWRHAAGGGTGSGSLSGTALSYAQHPAPADAIADITTPVAVGAHVDDQHKCSVVSP